MDEQKLFDTIQRRDFDLIEQMMSSDSEININIQDTEGNVPLHHACVIGDEDLVEFLLSKTPDSAIRNTEGSSPIHRACRRGFKNIVKLLCEYDSININLKDAGGHTPMFHAVNSGNFDLLQYLLQIGADVNISSELELTTIHVAQTKQIVDILLSHGADLEGKDGEGNTPLMDTSGNGHLSAVRGLCLQGANINHQGLQGYTALHFAVEYERADVVKYLLSRGVDIALRNSANTTAEEIAENEMHAEILEIFRDYQKDREIKGNLERLPQIKFLNYR